MTLSHINNTATSDLSGEYLVSARTYNMYPRVSVSSGRIIWEPTPGWQERLSLGRKQPRGSIVFKGKLYAVLDNTLSEIRINDTFVGAGTLRTAKTRCHLAESGIDMVITDGEYMYHTDGENFTTLTVPFNNPTGVVFHEGHFLAIEGGTGKVYYSAKFDGTSWDALDFFTAEDKSDNVLALSSSTMLMVHGEYTTQPYLSRAAVAPFYPYQQGRLYYGIIGDTAEVIAGRTVWLGRTKEGRAQICVHTGQQLAKDLVSQHAIQAISKLQTIDDAFSNTITWEGERWYILTFPTERRTFVMTQLGTMFEWGDYDAVKGTFVEHPMVDAQYFENTNFFFDDDGELQEFSADYTTHGPKPRISLSESNLYSEAGQRIFVSLWEPNITVGQGIADNTDATFQCRWSKDGGRTWSSWIPVEMGEEGEYDARVRIHRLGAGYKWSFAWRVSDEINWRMTRNTLDAGIMEPYIDRRNARVGGEEWSV